MNEILIRGLSTTVIGMLIVFITLGILSYVISLLKGIKGKEPENAEPEEEHAAYKPEIVPEARETCEVCETCEVQDLSIIAAITAAIAVYTGEPPERFRVFSVRRADTAGWRNENIREQLK